MSAQCDCPFSKTWPHRKSRCMSKQLGIVTGKAQKGAEVQHQPLRDCPVRTQVSADSVPSTTGNSQEAPGQSSQQVNQSAGSVDVVADTRSVACGTAEVTHIQPQLTPARTETTENPFAPTQGTACNASSAAGSRLPEKVRPSADPSTSTKASVVNATTTICQHSQSTITGPAIVQPSHQLTIPHPAVRSTGSEFEYAPDLSYCGVKYVVTGCPYNTFNGNYVQYTRDTSFVHTTK
jgi:hypothetical protein